MPTLRPSNPTRMVSNAPGCRGKVGRSPFAGPGPPRGRGPGRGADTGDTRRPDGGVGPGGRPGWGRRVRLAPGGAGLDLDVHARRQAELVQGVDGLVRRLDDVDEPLVGADLELLPRLLV